MNPAGWSKLRLADPHVLTHALLYGVDLSKVVGTGRDERITHADVDRAAGRPTAITAAAQTYAREVGITDDALAKLAGSGPNGEVTVADVRNSLGLNTRETRMSAVSVTPLVAKIAAASGVDLSTVRGSGVGGRIRPIDVHVAAAESAPPPTIAPPMITPPAPLLRDERANAAVDSDWDVSDADLNVALGLAQASSFEQRDRIAAAYTADRAARRGYHV